MAADLEPVLASELLFGWHAEENGEKKQLLFEPWPSTLID